MNKNIPILLTAVVNVALSFSVSMGYPALGSIFSERYPDSPLSYLSNVCIVCHGPSGPPLNAYGSTFHHSGFLKDIEAVDSDGDYFSNIDEINAGTFPGDSLNTPHLNSAMPLPSGMRTYYYSPVDMPSLNNNEPGLARPAGIGSAALGGDTVTLSVSIGQYSGLVDIYFGLYFPNDPVLYLVNQDNNIQAVVTDADIIPWKKGVSGVHEGVFGDVPLSVLKEGLYVIGLLVAPAGETNFTNYDLWIAQSALHYLK